MWAKYVLEYRVGTAGLSSPTACEGRRLERGDVRRRPRAPSGVSVCQAWSSSAAARYSLVAKPSLNVSTARIRVHDAGVDRLAGLVVLGVVLQHLWPEHPHLVDLARELDEVAVHVRAGELRVGHPREQPVQGVAELVEERRHLVEGQQRRLAGGGLGHVEVVDDDDRMLQQVVLRDQRVHPGPAALGVAGVQVEHVQPDGGPVGVGRPRRSGRPGDRRPGRGAR